MNRNKRLQGVKRSKCVLALFLSIVLVLGIVCPIGVIGIQASVHESEVSVENGTEINVDDVSEAVDETGTETEEESESGSETDSTQAQEQTFYDQLMDAETCQSIFELLTGNTEEAWNLSDEQIPALKAHVESLEDDGYKTDLLHTLKYLLTVDENGDAATYARPGGATATFGTSNHIEIEISGTVTVKIGNETFDNIAVTLTKDDTYTVSAYTLKSDGTKANYTDFEYKETTEGNGSTDDETIELTGTYPTGTKDAQVYYVVNVIKTVSVALADGTKLDIPVTLTVTTSYWDEGNNCPGIQNNNVTQWKNGYYISGSGIDVPISGEYVGAAITKGKLAIKKTVTGEDGSNAAFQFYLQNSSGEYLTFSGNAYTGTSSTLTDACKITVTAGQSLVLTDIPVGTYTITEIQKDGYIITDAEGNENDNYTKDYIVETKSDDEIPIANFTNKKLSDEAGIKIKKVGSGLSSYPNPTVAIYSASNCTNGVPNDGATAVWTGTLTTNSGDFIYLNVTLPDGEYVVVETGANVEGYDLTTTLTVDSSAASGMSFTAATNQVHELVVTNTYSEQPKVCDLTISKTVSGNMGDRNKEFSFTATLSGEGYSFENVTYSIDGGEAHSVEATDASFNFTLKHGQSITFIGLPIGATFVVTENIAGSEYVTTVDGASGNSKTITLAETNAKIVFENRKDITIDTGVLLDTMPYILILGIVLAGGILWFINKNRIREDF